MKILLASDLHFEFHKDAGVSFVKSCPDADVLVLAGDIATRSFLDIALNAFATRYQDVVYVPGNHEFWGGTYNSLFDIRAKLARNVHWLYRDVKVIQGQRFVGSTLWFSIPEHGHFGSWRSWADFQRIRGTNPAMMEEEHRKDVAFFKENLRPGDIAVSHHLPSSQFISPRFRGDWMNGYFASDTIPWDVLTTPAVWCFGHTHDSVDVTVDGTRFVCNPFGYAGHGLNPLYQDEFVLSVDTCSTE